jgi:membrane-associated PAP2 superfamily phosphatase
MGTPNVLRPTRWRIAAALGLYAALIVLFEFTSLDVAVQDRFFDFSTMQWIVPPHRPVPLAIFYTAPIYMLYFFGGYLLLVLLGVRKCVTWTRREALYVLLCMALVPAVVALGKNLTHVWCPWDLQRYGGAHPHRSLLESISTGDHCRCYPSGHASGGFGLFGLAFAGRRRSVIPGLLAGCAMGGYQMLRGAHFLSHTLASMLAAWIIAESLALAMKPSE